LLGNANLDISNEKDWDGTSYNMVYEVRAYALTQIVSLRSATSHTPKTLYAMPVNNLNITKGMREYG
jgi:hypothetical protein